jgi:rhodanese-related sulfurtransferase
VTHRPTTPISQRPAGARTVDDLLADRRRTLQRLTPRQAHDAVAAGAVIVDIRPEAQRRAEGEILLRSGCLVVERNVLEWRLDPASPARLPIAAYDLHAVILCSEGYASSLAAAGLQELGVTRATDIIGGFRAWATEGLPTTADRHLEETTP